MCFLGKPEAGQRREGEELGREGQQCEKQRRRVRQGLPEEKSGGGEWKKTPHRGKGPP